MEERPAEGSCGQGPARHVAREPRAAEAARPAIEGPSKRLLKTPHSTTIWWVYSKISPPSSNQDSLMGPLSVARAKKLAKGLAETA